MSELYENLPTSKYKCIVIDPPWHFRNKQPFPKWSKFKGASEIYNTLTTEEIKQLDVSSLAEDNCHLYIWTLDRFIPDTYELARHWGFNPTQMVYWQKHRGGKFYTGLGYYFRGSIEPCLFCVRGSLRLLAKDQKNRFDAPVGRHSAKPDEFYDMVNRVSPGPYLDMFARKQRAGWDVWGDQVE